MKSEQWHYPSFDEYNNQKPTVICFDDDISNTQTGPMVARIFQLTIQNVVGCQAAIVPLTILDSENKDIKSLVKKNSIIAYVIRERQFKDRDDDYPESIVEKIREYSSDTPIFFIPTVSLSESKTEALRDYGVSVHDSPHSQNFIESLQKRVSQFSSPRQNLSSY